MTEFEDSVRKEFRGGHWREPKDGEMRTCAGLYERTATEKGWTGMEADARSIGKVEVMRREGVISCFRNFFVFASWFWGEGT